MLTTRQRNLYDYLLEKKNYVSAETIVKEVPGYSHLTLRSALSSVRKDAGALAEAYAFDDLEYLVIGLNTHGYKIGDKKDTWHFINRRWKRLIKGIRVIKAIGNKAGLDGQLTFTDDGITMMDTVRKGEEE